jgi:hypothetical protein
MNRQEILLTILAEECVETAQRASKAIRFTLEEIQEGQDKTNAERIIYEFNDIMAVMQIMNQEGMLPRVIDMRAIQLKKTKIEKWLKYSEAMGALTPTSIPST